MSAQQHKPGAPVVGFNHNLNYKGNVFHVQTEDSGPRFGHIITHIFMGGNILSSTKSSYADALPTIDPGDIFSTVRKLMEDQHKVVMKGLMGGQHDAEISRRAATSVYEPGVLAGGEKAPGLLVGGDKVADPKAPAAARPPLPPQAGPRPAAPPPAPAPPPTTRPMAPPPPPMAKAPPPLARPLAAAPRPAGSPGTPLVPGTRAESPRTEGALFGDGLVSEKSLDEVILSYLSADLDAQKR